MDGAVRIAIFGLHEGTQESYRAEDWDQVWRMAHDPQAATANRVFEAHSEPIARKYGGDSYIDRLNGFAEDGLLWTLWLYPGMEICYHYPAHPDLLPVMPPQSSVAYMMHWAIPFAGPSGAIGLFGIDMAAGEEYGYQAPNMMYLIGIAQAKGRAVHIDPASSLPKSSWTGGIYGHPDNIDDMDYRLL